MPLLKNKVAIVTGGGGGIGGAPAMSLAAEGAKVAVVDIDDARAAAVAERLRRTGAEAIPIHADVSREKDLREMTAKTVEAFGGLDILVNNAVLVRPDDSDVLSMTMETWDSIMLCNTHSVVFGCKYAIPEMVKRGGG